MEAALSRNFTYDLIVIGGGPAGSAAATVAARRGASVLLLERGRFPRHKVCGEFVSPESLHLLRALLGSSASRLLQAAVRIRQARLFLGGKVLPVPIEPPAASISRLDLDAALWAAALASGAEARQQTTVHAVAGQGPFTVATGQGSFTARTVIDASGRWSRLGIAASHDQAPRQQKWLGLKAHFAEIAPAASVDLYFFPGGYCGVQPVSLCGEGGESDRHERINVCAMVRSDLANTLAEVFARHPQLQERSRGWKQVEPMVATSPLLFGPPMTQRAGVLLAGDAAGFVDPFAGDGIALALRSGSQAAGALADFLAGATSLEEARQRYGEAYEKQLAPVFRAASRLRRLLSLPGPLRAPLLRILQAPGVGRYLVKRTRSAA